MVKMLNIQNFEIEIKNDIVLVDFYADWCGPCKMLSPIIDTVAEEREDIIVGKVNVSENEMLAEKYNVYSIPTLIVFKNGKEATRLIGVQPLKKILELLDKV